MPVRKVSNKGFNIIGMYYSSKLDTSLPYESTGHRDCLILINYYKDTAWFDSEPLTINYYHHLRLRHYTPDILAERIGKPKLLIECKRRIQVDAENNQLKFAAAREYCLQRGMQFEVWIIEDIRSGFRLRNVKMLSRFARHSVTGSWAQKIINTLANTNEILSAAELAYRVDQVNYYDRLNDIFCMTLFHELHIPLDDKKITPLSPVYLPRE